MKALCYVDKTEPELLKAYQSLAGALLYCGVHPTHALTSPSPSVVCVALCLSPQSGDAMAPLGHRPLEEHGVERQLEYPFEELNIPFVGVLRTAAPALKAVPPPAESADANARPVAVAAAAASVPYANWGVSGSAIF